MVDVIVFAVSALIIVGGALGVILSSNAVHAALSLVASFFGVAVLFVLQEAHFLAFVQVVVYGGAIVVLFLFVLMLLGVDRSEDLKIEPLVGQRFAGIAAGVLVFSVILGGLFLSGPGGSKGAVALTGEAKNSATALQDEASLSEDADAVAVPSDVQSLARDLFGRNLIAFEATALLLTIASVGAVVMVRNSKEKQTVSSSEIVSGSVGE